MFKDVAYFYQKLLLPSAQNNITKVCKSIEVQFRNIHGLEIATHYEELFLRLAEKYFETGRTPISILPKVLPDVKPSEHRDPDVDLPSFSKLYASFGNTIANLHFVCSATISRNDSQIAFLRNYNNKNVRRGLLNCSARELKTNPKDKR